MEILNEVLNEFSQNPYKEEYLTNLRDDNNNRTIFSKELSPQSFKRQKYVGHNFRIGYNINDPTLDGKNVQVFAIKSLYKKEVSCILDIGGCIINSFTIEPDEIKWILNGTPLILDEMIHHDIRLLIFNVDETEILLEDCGNIIIYYSFLPSTFIIRTADTIYGHICYINENTCLVSYSNMGWKMPYIQCVQMNLDLTKMFHPKEKLNSVKHFMFLAEERCSIYKEELLSYVLHPDRIFANFNSESDNFGEYIKMFLV